MSDVVSLLDRPIYTYPQVDRALKLGQGTARRWLNGYKRKGTLYPPVLRPEPVNTPWVTWGEFVETRLFSGYRKLDDIPAQRMRRVVEVLRQEFDTFHPLAHARPYLVPEGREMLRRAQDDAELPEEFTVVVRTGQVVLAPWVETFVASAEFDENHSDIALALRVDEAFPDVMWDPRRRGGEPIIRNRNVLVTTLAGLVNGGENRADVAEWYDLTEDQVDQAVYFDNTHARIA